MKKNEIKTLRTEIEFALLELGKKKGVLFKVGNCSYGGSYCTFKLDVQEEGAPSKDESNFTVLAVTYGLKPEDLGAKFDMHGETFEICGLKPKSRK